MTSKNNPSFNQTQEEDGTERNLVASDAGGRGSCDGRNGIDQCRVVLEIAAYLEQCVLVCDVVVLSAALVVICLQYRTLD